MKISQNERILSYLKKGKSLTRLQALSLFGCYCLNSRVSDINRVHGKIVKADKLKLKSGKIVAKYSMA